MSIYADVKINLKDGRQVGTSDITQGSIRDAVLKIMEQCVPSEAIYGSTIIQGDSPLLQQAAETFENNVNLEFDALLSDEFGDAERMPVESYNFERFKAEVSDDLTDLIEIDTEEYSSAFLPSWTDPIYDADFNDKRNVAIFLRYCELFNEGKILFGVQTKNIASIELKLS